MFNVRLAGDRLYGKLTFYLVVAGNVFDAVLFCAVFFPTGCLE